MAQYVFQVLLSTDNKLVYIYTYDLSMDNSSFYVYTYVLSMVDKLCDIWKPVLSADKSEWNIYGYLLFTVDGGLYVFQRPLSIDSASVYVGLSVLTADSPLQAASGRASSDGCLPYFPERSLSAADADLDTTPASMMMAW